MTAYKVFVFCTIKKIVKIAQLIINQYIYNIKIILLSKSSINYKGNQSDGRIKINIGKLYNHIKQKMATHPEQPIFC